MTLPLRTRTAPQCSACLRSYAWAPPTHVMLPSSAALRQQVRGKKKSTRSLGTVPVRLLKDMPGYGRKGAFLPVSTGEMRNKWFPRRIAEYVTVPEMRTLRASSVPIERDYNFGIEQLAGDGDVEAGGLPRTGNVLEQPTSEKPKAMEKLAPERGLQLLEIFVKPVLEFYRQPIAEEKEEELAPEPETRRERQRTSSNAAADLLAARSSVVAAKPRSSGPQAIYGSVSRHDVLVHIRAAIAINDEAARVIIAESDIRFMDIEHEAEGKVKHVGDFTIEITVKGAEKALKRTVRVKPQEA